MPEAPGLATRLGLGPHPEGGWFRRIWTSDVPVARSDEAGHEVVRPTATAIHYLLAPGERSRWHRVVSDELWLHQRGAALELHLGGSTEQPGPPTTLVLGPDVEAGDLLQVLVTAGTWQAAGPARAEVLVTCVVSPGFDFADWSVSDG